MNIKTNSQISQALRNIKKRLSNRINYGQTKLVDPKEYSERQLTQKHRGKRAQLLEHIHFNIFMSPELKWKATQDVIATRVGCSRQYVNSSIRLFIARNELEAIVSHRHEFHTSSALVFSVPLGSSYWIGMRKVRASTTAPVASSQQVLTHYIYDNYLYINKRELTNGTRDITKKIWSMTERDDMTTQRTIPSYLDMLTNIKLTTRGKIKLSPFPLPAIRYADEQLPLVGGNASRISKLMNLCITYCHKNGLIPNWKLAAELNSQHPGLEDTPFEVERPSVQKATTSALARPSDFKAKASTGGNGSVVPKLSHFLDSSSVSNPERERTFGPKSLAHSERGTPVHRSLSQTEYDSLPSNVMHPYKKFKDETLPIPATLEEVAAASQKTQLDPRAAKFLMMVFGTDAEKAKEIWTKTDD